MACLDFDLSDVLITEFQRDQTQSGKTYYTAYFKCTMQISETELEFKVTWNGKLLSRTKIKDVQSAKPIA